MSHFAGMSGIYLSPSYKSAIVDWAPYVQGKKQKKHQFRKGWHELLDKIEELQEKPDKTPEDEALLVQLEEKQERWDKTWQNDEYNRSQKGYKTLFVIKVACPRDVYKKAQDIYRGEYERQQETGKGQDLFAFWNWGEQIFIPAELLSSLKILSSKKLTDREFSQEYSDVSKPGSKVLPYYPPSPTQQVWEKQRLDNTPK